MSTTTLPGHIIPPTRARDLWQADREDAFAAHVDRLVETELGPKANDVGKQDGFAWDTFRLLAREGVFATAFPQDYGGTEAPMRLRVRLIESVARVCSAAASMITGTDLSGRPVVAGASPELAREVVPKLASGELQSAFALTERRAGSDVAGLVSTARRDGDHYVLNGFKRFITRAPVADLFIVVARSSEQQAGGRGLSAFLVDRDSAGLTVGPMQAKMGWYGSPISEVILQDVRVPAARMLGAEGQGFAVAQETLIRARIGHAAIAIGRAQGAIEMAAQYAGRRRTFGQRLGEHQGVVWMLGEMSTQLEAARCLMRSCAQRYDDGQDVQVYASMAKQFATDLGMKITTDCLQLFGGNGYLQEFPLERFMRDAKLNQIGEGSSEIHKTLVGRAVLRDAAGKRHPCLDLDNFDL